MHPAKKLGYLLFLLPTVVLLATAWAAARTGHWNSWGFAPLGVVFVIIPILDALVGTDMKNATREEEESLRADPFYSALLVACVPAQLFAIGVGLAIVVKAPLSPVGVLGWTLSLGVGSSVMAITAGHELIHRGNRWLRLAGGVLLATVGYGSFKIEHILGHHVHVATPADPSTARAGDNAYAFVARALYTNIPRAYALEKVQAERRGKPFGFVRSETLRWSLLTGLLLVVASVSGGLVGALFFVGQAIVAVALLEVINFIEHYGLARRQVGARGAYEVTTPAHSWNSNHLISNLVLFQLQRHSDHHANAARPYQVLRSLEISPQLPVGYPSMVLLALVPPLYRVVMAPRLRAATPPVTS